MSLSVRVELRLETTTIDVILDPVLMSEEILLPLLSAGLGVGLVESPKQFCSAPGRNPLGSVVGGEGGRENSIDLLLRLVLQTTFSREILEDVDTIDLRRLGGRHERSFLDRGVRELAQAGLMTYRIARISEEKAKSLEEF
jgi:hypothetical protein